MSNDVYIYRAAMFRGDSVYGLMNAMRYTPRFLKEGNTVTFDVARSGREFIVSGERAGELVSLALSAYGGTSRKISE